jgi:molybdopterin molybdotransferase
VFARRAGDGTIEVMKYPREGAGLLSSLTETDGFAELAEEITAVEPGDKVGYLSFANAIG